MVSGVVGALSDPDGRGRELGAGAIQPYPPPLGNDLYPKLVHDYPETSGKFTAHLGDALAKAGFETGMAATSSVFLTSGVNTQRLLVDMGLYFVPVRAVPASEPDCYSSLVKCSTSPRMLSTTVIGTLNVPVRARPCGQQGRH